MLNIKKLFKQFLEVIKVGVKNPKGLVKGGYLKVVEERKKNYILKKYQMDKGLPVIDLLDLFPTLKSETINPYTYLDGTSFPSDLLLLKSLARKHKNCKYLEIGTWRGESIVNVADVAKECVSISLSDDELKKEGLPKEYIKLQRFFSNGVKNIKHIKHSSLTFDFSSLKNKFDLIFVDGDHKYESIKTDTQNAFKLLKNENSVIVWHDYGKSFEKINWHVLAAILDGCPREKRKHLYWVSNTKCAIYYPKQIKSKFMDLPRIPDKNFIMNISVKRLT